MIHWKDWCWSWSSNPLTTWCEEPTHWKYPDARKERGQEEKGVRADEVVGWHRWLNGYEFEQTSRDIEGQGGLAWCSPLGHKELDIAQRLNNNSWDCKPILSNETLGMRTPWVALAVGKGFQNELLKMISLGKQRLASIVFGLQETNTAYSLIPLVNRKINL